MFNPNNLLLFYKRRPWLTLESEFLKSKSDLNDYIFIVNMIMEIQPKNKWSNINEKNFNFVNVNKKCNVNIRMQ